MDREPLIFAFALHNHQPVGSFNSITKETYEKAYLPFFRVLSRYPDVHLSVHITGYLLEWLNAAGAELIDVLKTMGRRNQIEILTGTYYESIISLVPEYDAVNSIKAYSDRLKAVFEKSPRGMWLAERIYEPHLPRILSRAGIEYTALDDWHFQIVGMKEPDLFKPWIAEAELERITLFPVSRELRNSVLYDGVEGNMSYLRGLYEAGAAFVCLAAEGEKFGGTPETALRYYEEGWLEKFFTALTEAGDWLRVVSLGDAYDNVPAVGPVYLPNTSYYKMGRWALPADDQAVVETLGDDFTAEGSYGYLVPGAPVRNFLVRYPEANYIHKRMEATSRRLAELEAGGNEKPEIRRRLWMAQSNDAYWHGVSGGLYLPHLRRAVMENILAAERLVDEEISMGTFTDASDFDYDGNVEITLKDRRQMLVLVPNEGLAAKEWSFYDGPVCLTGVLERRPEPYHAKVRQPSGGGNYDKRTIYPELGDEEIGLENLLVYDKAPNRLLLDRFFTTEIVETDFWLQLVPGYVVPSPIEEVRFEKGPTEVTTVGSVNAALLLTTGDSAVKLMKSVSLVETGLITEWEYEALTAGRLGTGLSLSLVSPDSVFSVSSEGRTGEVGLGETAAEVGDRLAVSDDFAGWTLDAETDRSIDVWHYPIFTVSRSENGYEKIYQGAAFFLSFMVNEGETGSWTLRLTVDI